MVGIVFLPQNIYRGKNINIFIYINIFSGSLLS